MSRCDTMSRDSYRVSVVRPDGIHSHGSQFRSLESARDYFDTLDIPGCFKHVEHRAAGKARYVRIETMYMCTPDAVTVSGSVDAETGAGIEGLVRSFVNALGRAGKLPPGAQKEFDEKRRS